MAKALYRKENRELIDTIETVYGRTDLYNADGGNCADR